MLLGSKARTGGHAAFQFLKYFTSSPPAFQLVPVVIETSNRGERAFDIFSRLLRDRIICVNGNIEENMSSVVVAQLLFLESEGPEKPISMYINSGGGSVTAGLAIYDTMQYIRSPVSTLCMGQACSMASLLLAAGEPGQRRALPNSRIMIHQPSGGFSGQASDIAIHAEEILKLKGQINRLYEQHTKQSIQKLEKTMDRDYFMSPSKCVEFGIIDEVIVQRPPLEKKDS